MKTKRIYWLFLVHIITLQITLVTIRAEQPVMGMVPRWDEGYGFQVFWSYKERDELLNGSDKVMNSFGVWEQVSKTSIEGVYACGDIQRGASLVVWAIRDGRDCAEAILERLNGAADIAAE